MKIEKLPIFFGIVLSFLFFIFSKNYYIYKNSPKNLKSDSSLYKNFETIDLKYNDYKYQFRAYKNSAARVALVAIDDDSIRESGTWPWSRDLIAEITKNVFEAGAKSVAYDIIFSEPRKENPEGDLLLSQIVEKYSDKIILGTFSENEIISQRSYQDYCINEAFKLSQGEDIVKLNPSLVIDDPEDPFETVSWNVIFEKIFSFISTEKEKEKLKIYNKKDISELHEFQRNALKLQKTKALFDYCTTWLTSSDIILDNENNKNLLGESYKSLLNPVLFKDDSSKNQISLNETLEKFKNLSLFNPFPLYGLWTGNMDIVQKKSQYTASFVANQDSDGTIRRYPLFYRSGNKLGLSFIPSLALQSYLLAKNYRAEVALEKVTGKNIKKIKNFSIYNADDQLVRQIPIDSAGRLLINYYGTQMALPYIPAKELFLDSPEMEVFELNLTHPENPKGLIERKIVNKKEFLKDRSLIFGATAVGVYDLRTTPLEVNYPGPEVHLTVLANLLEENFLEIWEKEELYFPFLILVSGIIASTLWSFFRAISTFSSLFFILMILFSLDYYLFWKFKLVFTGFLILTIEIFVTNFSITFYKYFTEEKKKRQLKSTFSKYVSPAVVDELLKSDENLKLGGHRQRMSVFFSDVRGFTTISEKLAPEELSRVLNLYLTPMTEIVFNNQGTLDKYIGDAIMAFFGAPIANESHAEQACRCALQSLEKLKEIQKVFNEQNLPFIDIGIGINTGEMSVGNMGSNIVQNYTVMGDSVNLASRLEGITKQYGVRIVISEYTYKDISEKFIAREIDKVRVKGKNLPVAIFELIQEKSRSLDSLSYLDSFRSGYDFYTKKEFSDALLKFNEALNFNSNDKVSELYRRRCEDFLENPPPLDWDGVYVFKTK